ncbi:MipA/OmpV family protein [Terrarubrum flagellatum]|uniref:MipA/OmpV family protein n=1 Tax=Terrirubrum flagellatum TaxID=2895980 RepID=UPI0031453F1B
MATAAIAVLAAPAVAQMQAASVKDEGWIISLRANAVVGPAWPGSDKFSFIAFPSASIRRAGTPNQFSAPDDGIGLALIDNGVLRVGPVARFVGGRYASQDARLQGLRTIKWGGEFGAFAEFWPVQDVLRGRLEVRQGVRAHSGLVADVGLDAVYKAGQHTLSLGPRVSMGSDRYVDKFYSVTPAEAAANGLVSAYAASGGVTSVGALAAVNSAWSPTWSTSVYAGYKRLTGDAAQSPITRGLGSPNQYTFGATATYNFSFGGF